MYYINVSDVMKAVKVRIRQMQISSSKFVECEYECRSIGLKNTITGSKHQLHCLHFTLSHVL